MKTRAIALLSLLVAGRAFAQEDAQPQIAYRIFSDYVVQQQTRSSNKTWAYALTGVGGTFLAGSGITWFFGDQIMASCPGWNERTRTITTVALAGAGLSMTGAGIVGLCTRPVDYKSQNPLVFEEKDPVVQEAMAAAALKDLAGHGRTQRVTGALVGIATPILTLVIQTILNVSRGDEWYDGYGTVWAWQIPSMVSAFAGLFKQSGEERLYEKYLAARSAIYGSP